MIIIHGGGSVGILIDCVIDIKGEKGFFELFDLFNKTSDAERMKILFYYPYIYKVQNSKDFSKKLEQKKASVSSAKILEIINKYQARKSKEDLKKQKEEAEKKARM